MFSEQKVEAINWFIIESNKMHFIFRLSVLVLCLVHRVTTAMKKERKRILKSRNALNYFSTCCCVFVVQSSIWRLIHQHKRVIANKVDIKKKDPFVFAVKATQMMNLRT
ncbi:CLUMA_CG005990, isoform A [Clunio marinus]|uniref:CLUMA_CG005990, isoform A n=1 Tax=Clunio marinus TaxID=568069 RepID=A0A1J1HWN8_9DIPT|nr:CLUMA_CG005990, isoform A [Clunio marinus]